VFLCFVYLLTPLFIQLILFILTGLIVAKSSITSPIQEALTNTLKITKNHDGRVAMHKLFTSTRPPFRWSIIHITHWDG